MGEQVERVIECIDAAIAVQEREQLTAEGRYQVRVFGRLEALRCLRRQLFGPAPPRANESGGETRNE